MPDVHPTAIVSQEAQLAEDTTIGALAIIEGQVTLAAGCHVAPGAQLVGQVKVGEGSRIGRATIIGGDPQDLSFDPTTTSGVRIGSGCDIREHVTIHRSSSEGGETTIGDRNFLMVGAHLGHDVTMGDDNTLANCALLAGHVQIGSGCFLGGGAGFHQRVRVGDLAMVQGNSRISQDVPPYCTASGLNGLSGLNSIGLRRAGIPAAERRELKSLYRSLLGGQDNLSQALAKLEITQLTPPGQTLATFLNTPTQRGYCSPRTTR